MGNAGCRRGAHGVLGGHDEMIALGGNKLAQQDFRLPRLVAVGRVEEVATRLHIAVEDFFRFVALGTMPPTGAEIAGAQRKFRNA
ncbi:hypothetical protein D3C85_785790 [compost metagenome]